MQALDAPLWTASVLYQLLLHQAKDGLISIDELDRGHIAQACGLSGNAVNQAIFQLCQKDLLKRQGQARFMPPLSVFPITDWAHLHRAQLVVEVTTYGLHVCMMGAE